MKFGALWVGNSLPKLQQTCLASFIYYGHEVDLYVYDMSIEVPEGIVKKDASEILPESKIFVVDNSYAGFSDLFRYHMIQKTGKPWIDCDMMCMSSEWESNGGVMAGIEHGEDGDLVVGSVLLLPQDSEILKYIIQYAETYNKTSMVWSEIGPYLLTNAFKKFDLMDKVSPQHIFFGIKVHEFAYFWDPSKLDYILSIGKKSKCIALYNQMSSRAKFDKNNFPDKSPLQYFYNKFIINGLNKK